MTDDEIRARLKRQHELVTAYAKLLEGGLRLIPASQLPAPADELKAALRTAAVAAIRSRRLDDASGGVSYREAYTTSYAQLACVAPDDVAVRVNRFYRFFTDHGPVTLDTDVRALADKFLQHAPFPGDKEFERGVTTEMARLTGEFRDFLQRAEEQHERQARGAPGDGSNLSEALATVAPRWKSCVLLFVALTAATAFVHEGAGALIFAAASAVVAWRGYRSRDFPWGFELVRVSVIGAFVGILAWSTIAVPLQRAAIVRVSREIYFTSPEIFRCCLWDGRSPPGYR